MSKFKGTSGPWFVVEQTDYFEIMYSENYTEINLLDTDECFFAKYNAQLAAAAPDLLEVIELAQHYYERDKHLLNFDASLLKKAIEKAIGGQNNDN